MPRNLVDLLAEEEWENPISEGVLTASAAPAASPLAALAATELPEDTADPGVTAPATSPTPKSTTPRLRDDELLRAQGRARASSRRANFGRAMDEILGAAGGYKASDSFWDNVERQGAQGVADLKERRGMERQGRLDAQADALTSARVAALESKGPKKGRYALLAGPLGVTPEALDNADPAVVRSMVELVKAGKAVEAKRLADEEQRKWLETEHVKDRSSRERAAALSAGAKSDLSDSKSNVPGLEKVEGATPTEDDAKKVKVTMDAANRMKPLIAQLRALHNVHGTELVGSAANEMEQIMTAIKLEAKTIAELGALSGPDLALMNQLSGIDPTSLKANAKALFGLDNTKSALTQLERWIDTSVDAKKKTYGYRDKPGTAPAPRVATPESAQVRKAYSPSTGKTYLIDASGQKVGEEEGDTRGR